MTKTFHRRGRRGTGDRGKANSNRHPYDSSFASSESLRAGYGTQGNWRSGEAVGGMVARKNPSGHVGQEGCVWLEKENLLFVCLKARDS